MKYMLILCCFLGLFFSSCQQQPAPPVAVESSGDLKAQYSDVIFGQASAMAAAFQRSDWETFTEYNHPRLVEMLGSKQGIADVLKETIAKMEAQGYFFDTIVVQPPHQVVRSGNQLQCLLLQTLTVENDSVKMSFRSNLVGVSADGGKNWKFLDTMGETEARVRGLLPELSTGLKFQTFELPVVEKKSR